MKTVNFRKSKEMLLIKIIWVIGPIKDKIDKYRIEFYYFIFINELINVPKRYA